MFYVLKDTHTIESAVTLTWIAQLRQFGRERILFEFIFNFVLESHFDCNFCHVFPFKKKSLLY